MIVGVSAMSFAPYLSVKLIVNQSVELVVKLLIEISGFIQRVRDTML